MNVVDSRFGSQITSCPSPKCGTAVIWCTAPKGQLLIDAVPAPYVAGQPFGEYALKDLADLRPSAVKLKPTEVFGRQGTLHEWHYNTCQHRQRFTRRAYTK